MELENLFKTKKPILGMIHLAGSTTNEKIQRALDELVIYEEEGVNGAIIEDYHGGMHDVYDTLKEASKSNLKLVLGLNVLRNPYLGFVWAEELGGKFIQFDNVQTNGVCPKQHKMMRERFPNIYVLGGVRFKYTPQTGNSLEQDIAESKKRCDAIVTTGEGTGIETPIEKLKNFKSHMDKFPLFVGAGVIDKNCYEQLTIADGAIVGSYFKPNGNTNLPVDRYLVKNLMGIVNEVRKNEF
jgi:hypothetical protein